MLKIGITGGIGSGKSMVCKVFENLGVPVFYADDVGKRLLEKDAVLQTKVKKSFGDDIYGAVGLNRRKLGALVFNNPERLRKLNELVHPRVLDAFQNWVVQYSERTYVLLEAAILFESGVHHLMDLVISVTAPEELRMSRVASRDHVSKKEVQSRMKNQMSAEKINRQADYLLVNDEKKLLLPRIIKLHHLFLEREK